MAQPACTPDLSRRWRRHACRQILISTQPPAVAGARARPRSCRRRTIAVQDDDDSTIATVEKLPVIRRRPTPDKIAARRGPTRRHAPAACSPSNRHAGAASGGRPARAPRGPRTWVTDLSARDRGTSGVSGGGASAGPGRGRRAGARGSAARSCRRALQDATIKRAALTRRGWPMGCGGASARRHAAARAFWRFRRSAAGVGARGGGGPGRARARTSCGPIEEERKDVRASRRGRDAARRAVAWSCIPSRRRDVYVRARGSRTGTRPRSARVASPPTPRAVVPRGARARLSAAPNQRSRAAVGRERARARPA